MNILFTITAYPPAIGGAQFYAHYTACALARAHQVQVVTQWDTSRTDWLWGTTVLSPTESQSYVLDGVPVCRLILKQAERLRLLPWVLLYYPLQGLALPQIARVFADHLEPFAVQSTLVHNIRIGREGLSYASLEIARKHGLPFVFTPLHHPRWGTWFHRYYHRLYREADALIALTEVERLTLIELGARPERVYVTGTGPVLAEKGDGLRFRNHHHLPDAALILFLGQKYAYKGLATLLEAARLLWQSHPDTYFIFIGPRTNYSRRLFASVSDKRLLELDAVDTQEKTDALAACEVLCLPSTQESFGSVFTEAWSLGKPVIGCDVSAVRTVIADGQDGFLIPPSAGPLAERLAYLLDHQELGRQMGQNGSRKVNEFYSWPRLAERTEQIYQSVLQGVIA